MALRETIKRKNSGSIGQNFISYPQELGTMERSQHYVMFYINMQSNSKIDFGQSAADFDSRTNPPGSVKRETTTLTMKRAPVKRMSQAIALYMPAQLQMSHKAAYGEPEIGTAVANVMSTIDGYNSGMGMDQMAKNIVSAIGNTAEDAGMAILDEIAPGARAVRDIRAGKIRNNRSEMAFEGIDRRSFSFTFRMLPTNPKEAEAIEDIVTTFRFHAMPELDGEDATGRTMIMPSTFDIEYHPNEHLHRISTSVLEGVDIQYGGDRPQFFTDGQPVETQLTLTFKELEIITKERILAGF